LTAWLHPPADLDVVAKKKFPLCRESNPGRPGSLLPGELNFCEVVFYLSMLHGKSVQTLKQTMSQNADHIA
jgi:hypothetical protein